MTSPRTPHRVAVLLLGWLIVALWPATAAAADTVAFTIDDKRIDESSGLATDPTGDQYWTINDSGDEGVAYALNTEGEVTGTLNFRVDPVDVEAIAMANQRLYIADIGDNDTERDLVTVYYFDKPKADDQTELYHSWDFEYPDGAHDAETLLVNAAGRVFIVTKGDKPAIYIAPKELQTVGVNKLKKVGDAPSKTVTDGTFLPNGQIALLTYTSLELVDPTSYEELSSTDIPEQDQAESMTISLDQQTLLIGSEGRKTKVYSVALPADPTATPTPTPSAEAPVEDSTESTTGLGNRNTYLAVGLAGLVAIVAGVVVAVVRRA